MCNTGMSLLQIEKHLSNNRLRLFHTLREKFEISYHQLLLKFPEFESDSFSFWRSSPKHHAISACYLKCFWQKERVYHHHKAQVSITQDIQWLSCDHTFKSVRNIGTIREADGSWIKQYKGLFCVLNNIGQVVTWKMTRNLAMDDVYDILQALQERLLSQGVTLQVFYVDNCCGLRQKLQGIFGLQLMVFLDVFHAVQRITRKVPKRHPYNHDCLQSIRMVFRSPTDQGSQRTQPTPAADVLRAQLLDFKSKWESVSYEGKPVLPPAAVREVLSLLTHIQKGCLSGIRPGCGTTRNERLHRDLNLHMTSAKMEWRLHMHY